MVPYPANISYEEIEAIRPPNVNVLHHDDAIRHVHSYIEDLNAFGKEQMQQRDVIVGIPSQKKPVYSVVGYVAESMRK